MKCRSKKQPVPVLLILLLTVFPATSRADDHPTIDLKKGWQQLFNGKDLSGWTTRGSNGQKARADSWVVEDGAIARRGGAYLWSDEQFGDFILDMEFKVAPRTNSGIIIRHDPESKSKKSYWWDGLLEVQILDSAGKAKPGSSVFRCKTLETRPSGGRPSRVPRRCSAGSLRRPGSGRESAG